MAGPKSIVGDGRIDRELDALAEIGASRRPEGVAQKFLADEFLIDGRGSSSLCLIRLRGEESVYIASGKSCNSMLTAKGRMLRTIWSYMKGSDNPSKYAGELMEARNEFRRELRSVYEEADDEKADAMRDYIKIRSWCSRVTKLNRNQFDRAIDYLLAKSGNEDPSKADIVERHIVAERLYRMLHPAFTNFSMNLYSDETMADTSMRVAKEEVVDAYGMRNLPPMLVHIQSLLRANKLFVQMRAGAK